MYIESMLKRIFDLIGFLISIIVFGPIFLLLSIAIYLDDRNDIFFKQDRVGKNKKIFKVYKFRTMQDGQITRVGKWVRKTGLDELPQYINILKGDMSIVGPRPLTTNDITRLNWENQLIRWNMLPGLTGLAQIRSGVSAHYSLQADFEYQKKASLFLDIKIVIISFFMNALGKRRVQKIIPQIIFNQ